MMMNENNEVFTMEDEPLATLVQNMRKGSKWLSVFLESYRPPLDGERYLTDRHFHHEDGTKKMSTFIYYYSRHLWHRLPFQRVGSW